MFISLISKRLHTGDICDEASYISWVLCCLCRNHMGWLPPRPSFLIYMKIYCQAVALSTHHLKMIQWDEHKVFDPSSEETETGETGFLWLENIIFGKLTVSCRNLCAVIIFYLMCRCYSQYSYRQRDAAQIQKIDWGIHAINKPNGRVTQTNTCNTLRHLKAQPASAVSLSSLAFRWDCVEKKNVSCLGSTVSARGDMKYAALCSPLKKKHQIEANQYSHCLFYLWLCYMRT